MAERVPTQDEEMEAKRLIKEAYELLIKKRDQSGAAAKFKECLEKYSHTRYMNEKVPPSNKPRKKIIEDR